MGLGKAGAIGAAKQGGILTVVLLSAYRVVDYVLTDQATLSQLIGTLATDVVKVGIATGASIGIAVIVGATTMAIGPIVAVIVVGVGTSMLLEYTDNNLGITNRVIAGLDELVKNTETYITEQKKQYFNSLGRVVNQIIDHAIESTQTIAINWVRSTLREYLSPYQRKL